MTMKSRSNPATAGTDDRGHLPDLVRATNFAAWKHRHQRRKDEAGTPYINHPIDVVSILVEIGGIAVTDTLVAAMLHDTVEDTDTTEAEIEACFGPAVSKLVMEVTDDKSLAKPLRKRLQIEHAPGLSPQAKLIKLADKIANVSDICASPPAGWDTRRRSEYLNWSTLVVAGCRGQNPSLEIEFDERLHAARSALLAA